LAGLKKNYLYGFVDEGSRFPQMLALRKTFAENTSPAKNKTLCAICEICGYISLRNQRNLRLIKPLLAGFTNGVLQNAPADVDETFAEARFEERFAQERQAG